MTKLASRTRLKQSVAKGGQRQSINKTGDKWWSFHLSQSLLSDGVTF
ncbi:hypothetical protein ACNAN0_04745 [Agrilactobacillus fermenti]